MVFPYRIVVMYYLNKFMKRSKLKVGAMTLLLLPASTSLADRKVYHVLSKVCKHKFYKHPI